MSNQGRICIAITKSEPMGGAQKYVFELATELKKRGFEVTAIAGPGELLSRLEQEGVSTIALQSSQRDISLMKEFRLAQELYRVLRDLRPDVLHLNSSKLGVLGSVVGRLAGIRTIVFTAHGWAFNENRPSYQKAIFYLLYWITLGICNMTICVSKKTRKQIEALPFTDHKTTVVYNGIRMPDFLLRENAKGRLTERFPFLDKNKRWIAVLAELHPVKGHDVLFNALLPIKQELENCQVVCMGGGQLQSELADTVRQKNLGTYVYFTGPLAGGAQYLKAFDMFVLPSRSEALPLSLLEAGLAQVPVIASDVGGIPEVVTDGQSGFLFENGNSGQLAEKLRTALTSDSLKNMSDALSDKVSADFSIDQMVEKTIAVYNSGR